MRIDAEDEELIERLASLEHDQWCAWATSLSLAEKLSKKRVKRWNEFMRPYEELSEEAKQFDRVWAKKVINVLKSMELIE